MKHNRRVRKGDKVKVITGNDRGLVGEVLSRTDDRVLIRGINVRKKHVKKSQENPSGGIIQIEKPIHISNVAICVDEDAPKKLQVSINAKGKRELVYKEGDKNITFRSI